MENKKSRINPFAKVENAEQETNWFVDIFSDYAVDSCVELYRQGNVIIKGIEGSGKTMLLNLLKPEIRISYHKKGIEFPLHDKFFGAGINFVRCNLLDIGSRLVTRAEFGAGRKQDAPYLFGDFINYWVVRDIIKSIITFKKELKKDELISIAGLDCSSKKFAAFTESLSQSPAWSGYLLGVESFEDLIKKLDTRIFAYRHIITQSRPDPLPEDIYKTITEVGEPISQTVDSLYKCGILMPGIPVLIRFDQYENLLDGEEFDRDIAEQYRQVVNKFLWTRDPKVSFKFGIRPYALDDKLKVFGLGSLVIEPERDFICLDLDEKLRRKEDRSSWIFPKLAEDVFSRRLVDAGYPKKKMIEFFGSTMSPHKKAQITLQKNSRPRALDSLDKIPTYLSDFMIDLAVGEKEAEAAKYSYFQNEEDIGDLLSAKLGIAWILQKKKFELNDYTNQSVKGRFILPWNDKNARWWKKERINQALLQISSNSGQRTYWSGKEDILTLSSSNMLIFLNICREIWRVWDQAQRAQVPNNEELSANFDTKPIIGHKYQSAGIYATSSDWYHKVMARTKGDSRKKFIEKVSRELSTKLKADKKMSYPGHNGFSLSVSEYEESELAQQVIKKAVRFGDLFEMPHTPKNKNQEKRLKWYLLPILSPERGLPPSHTKEPYYLTISKVEKWISESQETNKKDLMK